MAPPVSRILTMVAFAGSCVGLLLYLWLSFGGTVPLAPKGYRIVAQFGQAVELGSQAQVEIAGVPVGRVVSVSLDRRTGLTRAVLQIDPSYAPRPVDTRAILRQKTLLGETYVELTPGTRGSPMLPDGGHLRLGHVAPTVQLDQILNTFDPTTRRAFETWMQQDGIAFTRRGQDFNDAIGELYPFATNVTPVLAVLRRDSAAASVLLRDGGQVFSALARSPAALQGMIRHSNEVFSTTAERNRELAAAIRAFPGFLVATRRTVSRLYTFSAVAKPLVDELRPAAIQLSPALERAVPLAPELDALLTDLPSLTKASRTGVPALRSFLGATVPLLARLRPYLGNVVPVIDYVNVYRRELAAFFANSAAVSQAVALNITGKIALHYLRISNPVNPEVLTSYDSRLQSNRANPYMAPGGYSRLVDGLQVFGSYLCTHRAQPGFSSKLSASTVAILKRTYYTSRPGGPPCRSQAPLGQTTEHENRFFPQLRPLP